MHWLPARYLSYVRSLAKNGGVRAKCLFGECMGMHCWLCTNGPFLVRLALLIEYSLSWFSYLYVFGKLHHIRAFPLATAFAFVWFAKRVEGTGEQITWTKLWCTRTMDKRVLCTYEAFINGWACADFWTLSLVSSGVVLDPHKCIIAVLRD